MKYINHNNNAINVCKYVLNYIRYRQKTLAEQDLFKNRMALLEEYREWISEGITKEYLLYVISKNEIPD